MILDTSILIAGERQKEAPEDIFVRVRNVFGPVETAISTITVVELTHGIYRAKTPTAQASRLQFAQSAFRVLIPIPVSFEIAQLAGRIEGQQAANGIAIPTADLLIGATALHLGFDLATHNTRHFQLISGLSVVTI
jgi:tRNA(fMet)-specific endonuclease VapC